MEGSVSNVQFTVSRRGFDPDEVANYLAQIDEKIVGLRAMAAEAIERAERAEEQVRRVDPDGGLSDEEVASRAAGVLAMAQRTADAALTTAREDADRIRLSAEAHAEQLRVDTQRELDSRRGEHVAALRRETDELVAVRDRISDDIVALQRQLDEERARVLEIVAALSAAAGASDAPSAVVAPPVALVPDPVDISVDPADDPVVVEPLAVVEPVAAAEEEQESADVLGFPSPSRREEPVWGDDPDATSPLTNLFGDDVVNGGPPVDNDEGRFSPDEDLSGGSASGAPVPDRPDPVEGSESSFDDDDDDAMRAFFEGGEDDDDDRGSRWGFRRR